MKHAFTISLGILLLLIVVLFVLIRRKNVKVEWRWFKARHGRIQKKRLNWIRRKQGH